MKPVEIPGITLHHFTREWNARAAESFIQSLRSVGEDTFILKTKSRTQTMEWLIRFPSILIESSHTWTPLEDQPGFVKRTKQLLDNQKIVRITQHGMDRIVDVKCRDIRLIIELFGDGNMVIVDAEDKILDVLNPKEWKTRTLRKGETYSFPPGPLAWDHLSVEMPMLGKSKNVAGMLVTQVGVPAIWSDTLAENDWKTIRETLKKRYNEKPITFNWINAKGKNWIMPRAGEVEDVFSSGKMDEIQNRLEEWLVKEPIVIEEEDEKVDKEKNALKINLERQEKQKKEWEEEARQKQRAGEWIYEHFDIVEKLLDASNQAKKKKMSDEETLDKIQGKIKHVKKVDLKKGQIKLEVE
jgi:predicted ribosome quality control (RQC) complex YloA/Tae2 family protein